ncbi:MAG: selenoneine biosynthesis selenosugar synthase SenB [Actinomycetota bacterium]
MTDRVPAVLIVAPRRPTGRSGNDVTAARWAALLTAAGHPVDVVTVGEDEAGPSAAMARADVLIAIHARRTAVAVQAWSAAHPDRPLVVALAGTDLYVDVPGSPAAMASIERADRLLVLQTAAVGRLCVIDERFGAKARVVNQSVDPTGLPSPAPVAGEFRVVVLAHLRDVKDPLLAARAAARLPADSPVRVHHAGRALSPGWADNARAEAAGNPRYRWYGELDRPAALDLLASGHVLACTSIEEGGANVVTEALAVGVPVVGTRIDGNTGLLGDDHPGLVPVGDDVALADLLHRLVSDPSALADLRRRSAERRPLTDPVVEQAALVDLVAELH